MSSTIICPPWSSPILQILKYSLLYIFYSSHFQSRVYQFVKYEIPREESLRPAFCLLHVGRCSCTSATGLVGFPVLTNGLWDPSGPDKTPGSQNINLTHHKIYRHHKGLYWVPEWKAQRMRHFWFPAHTVSLGPVSNSTNLCWTNKIMVE